jgi:SAM-dependent methyltransferase
MHDSVLKFVADVVRPEDVAGKSILECGAAVINGSVKPQLIAMGPASYVGIDLNPGQNVDIVSAVEDLPTDRQYDLVVSCELLEHAERWVSAFRAMAQLVAPGGALVLTCRGLGFPYHNPPDHWRFEPSDLWRAAVLSGLWPTVCQADPQVPGAFIRAEKMFGADGGPLQPHALNVLAGYPVVRPSPAGRR